MKRDWSYDGPEFRRGPWKYDAARGYWYAECEELIEGRWEGFIAMKSTEDMDRLSRPTNLTEIGINE